MPAHNGNAKARAAGLFAILFCFYFLTYGGGFHSTDEMSMFAVTESLTKLGRPTSNQLLWMAPYSFSSDAYGADGELYSKKGPVVSFMALPLYWAALRIPNLGAVESVMLLNAIVTALTGGILFLYLARLGYGQGSALAVSLVYGLGTMAWVYAKFLFSEPAAALFLLLAAYLLLPRRARWWQLLGAGVALGLAVGTRYAEAAAIPVFLGYVLWRNARAGGRQAALSLLYLCIGLGVVALLLGYYNLWRFGHPLAAGYQTYESFTLEHLPVALLGFLISPGRSLFIYSPALLLCLASLSLFLKRHRAEGALGLGVVVVHLAVYGLWYQWWGGACWGPRFLLPAIPFLALAAAPLLEKAWKAPLLWQGLLGAWLLISVVMQLAGVAVDFNRTPQPEGSTSPIIWDPQRWPLVEHMRLVRLDNLDIAWTCPERSPVRLLFLGGGLGLLAMASATTILAGRRHRTRIFRALPWLLGPASVLFVFFALAQAPSHRHEPKEDFAAMFRYIEATAQPSDALVLNLPLTQAWVLDQNKLMVPAYGLAKNSLDADLQVESILERIVAKHRRLWFMVEWTPEADPQSGVERWLAEHAYRSETLWFGDQARLALFLSPGPASTVEKKPGIAFGSVILLESYHLEDAFGEPLRVILGPGEHLRLGLRWQALASMDERYKVFLHLINPSTGHIVAQVDGEPQGGFRPTSTWRPGEAIADNYALALPTTTLEEKDYLLIAGVYRKDGIRLQPHPPAGAQPQDWVPLAQISVRAQATSGSVGRSW